MNTQFLKKPSSTTHKSVRNIKRYQGITVRQFIDTAKQLDIFNLAAVREMANTTQVISDMNPQVNRDTALSRDLFHSGLSTIDELNETLNES